MRQKLGAALLISGTLFIFFGLIALILGYGTYGGFAQTHEELLTGKTTGQYIFWKIIFIGLTLLLLGGIGAGKKAWADWLS